MRPRGHMLKVTSGKSNSRSCQCWGLCVWHRFLAYRRHVTKDRYRRRLKSGVTWQLSFRFSLSLRYSLPSTSCLRWNLLQISPAGDRTCTRLLAFLRMRADFEAQQNDGIVRGTSKELYPSSCHAATFAIFPRWLTLMSTMLLMRWIPGRPARLHTVAKPSHPWCRQRRRNSKFVFSQSHLLLTFSISDSFLLASRRWLSQIVQKDLCQ